MKNTSKLLSLILALVMVFSFAAVRLHSYPGQRLALQLTHRLRQRRLTVPKSEMLRVSLNFPNSHLRLTEKN